MSCSSDDQSDKECPLCMEQLEIDDWNFYPCKCEYQICRFCWHRLRTDENGLCPACRQPYPEEPLNFKPLSTADMAKMKSEKKMKQQAEKQRISESRKHLASYRVLQKNLVYVVGLSARVADPEMLKKPEYFGKYGKITKVAVGTTTSGVVGSASHTAYVTYMRVEEALKAIQGVQNALVDGRVVKASLGTTKYCSSFLRSQSCYKPECMYLHDMADADISFTKEDMHAGKHADYEKRLMDTLLKTAVPPVPQSIVPPQPLISSTLSNTLAAAARKKTELNGTVKDPKSVEEERREKEKEEERKMEEEFPPVSAAVPLSVPAPVPATPSSPVPSTVPSTTKQNGKTKKSEEKSTVLPKSSSVKKEKKEKTVIPSSPATRIPRDIMTMPRELSASPPDDWTSRDDGPSCSPPPGLPAPPHLVAANSSTTMTPPSESSASPPRGDTASVSSVTTPQWQTLLGLAPRPVSPPCNGFFSDDDLGFDPFHESSRELAALVEEERKAVPPPPPPPQSYLPPPPALPPPPHLQHLQHHQQQQMHHQHNGGFSSFNSFGMDSMGSGHFSSLGGLSSLYSGGLNGLDSSPLDAFSFSTNGLGGGSSFPSLSSHSLSSRFPSLDMTSQSLSSRPSYDPSSSFSSSSLFPPPPPPGLGVPHGLSAPPPPGLGPPRPMMGGGAPGLAPPSGVPQGLAALAALRNAPPSTCSTSSSTRAPLMSKAEWQEGFKSLLPNINVRFSAELERELR